MSDPLIPNGTGNTVFRYNFFKETFLHFRKFSAQTQHKRTLIITCYSLTASYIIIISRSLTSSDYTG